MSRIQTPLYETRSEAILRHVTRYVRETKGVSYETFSEDVVAAWHGLVPESARGKDFRDTGGISERIATNSKKLRRWCDPHEAARPSIDVEEALVHALPEPYRAECLRELAMRHGGLFVALANGADGALQHAGELMRECGEVLTALGPLLANDGRITADDDEQLLLRARKELLDVGATVHRMVADINHALDEKRLQAGRAAA